MPDHQFLTLDGRPTVRVERRYPHPIEKVWRAVTTPEHLGEWFPYPVDVDLRPGGAMTFRASGVDDAVHGTIEVLDSPRLFTFTWGTDRMTFELAPDGNGTRFALTHSFDDRAGAASFATGWEMCLAGLRHVLAGEELPPPDRGVARHEELVHEFGLDRPVVIETDGSWTVRYERQLTCPAEIAWGFWFGIDQVTGEQRTAPAVGEPLTPYMAPELVIGTMTEVDAPRILAFDVAPTGGPGDHVCVEFSEGTGHGARLVLTVSGTNPAERAAAEDQWGAGAIGHLAAAAAAWATSPAGIAATVSESA